MPIPTLAAGLAPGLAARLARAPSPTVDLYLLNALAPGLAGPAMAGLRRRAPSVFETDAAVLVLRHDAGAPAPRRGGWVGGRRLVYLLDDAVFEGLRDPALPMAYRLKLWAVECAAARRLIPRAAALVVSGPAVAEALPRGLLRPETEVHVLDPYWSEPLPDLAHQDDAPPLRLAFAGAQTHAAALARLAPALADALAALAGARLHLSASHRPPRPLRGHPALRPEPAVRWPAYRAALAGMRRHIALYPLAQGPFAAARSANKLIELALMGAAPLYPARWPQGAAAAAEGAGLALPDDPGAWFEAILALAADPGRRRALAEGAQRLARRLNDPAPQRALWRRLLELPGEG